jgi:RNA polymerase sigma factor (sigma-70 family)
VNTGRARASAPSLLGVDVRALAPQVLGALVRRFGDFPAAEDAVQEALLDAATRWPVDGLPDNPRGWLIRVAHRRMTDHLRSEIARRRREDTEGVRIPRDQYLAPPADAATGAGDDSLTLLFMCCHPSLVPAAQIPLTLRAVGGLTTTEIASAFLVPEATMTKRITRAKQKIRSSGIGFRTPPAAELPARLSAVLQVLYLIFNEGYTATEGEALHRVELTAEAIRLARMVHRLLPEDHEVAGLLALMLLTDARRPARLAADGSLVPMAEQDRELWDQESIAEGVGLVTRSLVTTQRFGPFLLQAAIAAVHDESPNDEETDWPQILGLYRLLRGVQDNPVIVLNQAVAESKVHGPEAGLAVLAEVADDPRLAGHHRVDAVRGHLLESTGDLAAAKACYLAAARRTRSEPERRYLLEQADRISVGGSA